MTLDLLFYLSLCYYDDGGDYDNNDAVDNEDDDNFTRVLKWTQVPY